MCLEPGWHGPFQVFLDTSSAVKCPGLPNWMHAAHTQRTVPPVDEGIHSEDDQQKQNPELQNSTSASEGAPETEREADPGSGAGDKPVVSEPEVATVVPLKTLRQITQRLQKEK